MSRAIVFFCLVTLAFASQTLDTLINAAAAFAVAIHQQLEAVQSDPPPARLAEKTIEYATAKIAYFSALRTAAPELTNIATRRQARPPELDRLAEAFSLAGEKQEMAADQRTRALLERSVGNSEVEKARAEFERAQKVEEQFHKDFDSIDFTLSIRERRLSPLCLFAIRERPAAAAGRRSSTR